MRRLVFVALVAVLLAACSSATPRFSAVYTPPASTPTAPSSVGQTADTAAWVTVAPDGQGFSVRMPGQPTSISGTSTSAGSPLTYTYWTCTDSDGRSFLVELIRFSKGALAGPAKPILDETERLLVSGYASAQVESESDITLGGHAGRTAVFANATTRVQGEAIIVDDAIYELGVSYPIGLADDGVVNAFMASFNLTV